MLTPRERDIAERLAAGQTHREIADALDLSRSTVHTHVRRAAAKLPPAKRPTLALIRWHITAQSAA